MLKYDLGARHVGRDRLSAKVEIAALLFSDPLPLDSHPLFGIVAISWCVITQFHRLETLNGSRS